MSLFQNQGNPRTELGQLAWTLWFMGERVSLAPHSLEIFGSWSFMFSTLFTFLYAEDFISQKVCFHFLSGKLDNLHPKF